MKQNRLLCIVSNSSLKWMDMESIYVIKSEIIVNYKEEWKHV